MTSAMKRFFKRFARDTRGSIMIIAAFAASGLIAVGGAAYDFGMQQMAWKNSQFAGDIAATSAAGSRLNEPWGRGTDGATLQKQENRVRMFFDINSRGFDVDPQFHISELKVIQTPEVYRTIVRGDGEIPSHFVRMVGVSELPYAIETITDLRNPGEQPVFDMVLLLDYTDSMLADMTDGDTRIGALRKAGKALTNTLLCGNENGQEPCEEASAENRIGMIPYGLTAIGLDVCDLPEGHPDRPWECACQMPRDYEGTEEDWLTLHEHEGGMPEMCRPACERIGADGRPASDPLSEHFNCGCLEDPLSCDLVISELNEIERIIYERCTPKCQQGGCCPSFKCEDTGIGNSDCMQRQLGSYPSSPCCHERGLSCQTVSVTEPATCEGQGSTCVKQCPEGETTCSGEVCGIVIVRESPQTVCCDKELCTRSCTASGGPSDPCEPDENGVVPRHCIPPENPPRIPPRPVIPGLGMNEWSPKAEFASAEAPSADDFFAAVYNPGEDVFAAPKGNDPRLILTQSQGGVWARSLHDCEDDGRPNDCMPNTNASLLTDYMENNTNSASAFEAFGLYTGYLDAMRTQTENGKEVLDVVVWVTDGENNRYRFPNTMGSQQPPIIIPEVELIDADGDGRPSSGDRWQCATTRCTPEELEEVKLNRYNGSGQYVAPGKPGYDSAKTAQQWSDYFTLQQCERLRERQVDGEEKPIIIYTVAVGDVGNLSTEVGKHTARIMNECSYGIAGHESDVPPEGQPKRFFVVQDSSDLNRAFKMIINALGRIRIID